MSVESSAREKRSEGLMDAVKTIIQALILAMIVKIFFYQPFNIPSGSMKSTLLVGDYLFVSKFSYGYSRYSFPFSPNLFSGRLLGSEPERGDVAVFRNLKDDNKDYIKRIIGMPGDKVQVLSGIVYINGKEVPRKQAGKHLLIDDGPNGYFSERLVPRYKETLPNGVSYYVLDVNSQSSLDNTAEYAVPEGHYFLMGDNRDQSQDSRVQNSVGMVAYDQLIGRADILFFSADYTMRWYKPWTWFSGVRWSRLFDFIR
ncbi:MAG: signal peptidase I [Pseudomonadota bacterium]